MKTAFFKKNWNLFLVGFIALLLLILTVNPGLPYEQDQPSKAAQILLLSRTNHYFNMSNVLNLYAPTYFSFYFILSALLYKLFGGDIIKFMNYQAVICGLIFSISFCLILKWRYKINPLLGCFLIISIPIVIITYTYGNEVNYALTLFSLSLLLITSTYKHKYILAPLFFILSTFSRPDYLLLFPFWLGLIIANEKECQVARKDIVQRIMQVILLLIIYGISYWIIFIRENPLTLFMKFLSLPMGGDQGVDSNTNLKLVISYLTYPFNLSVVLLGIGGLIWILINKKVEFILMILLTLPVIYYFTHLYTPKDIASLILFFGIPAAILLSKMKWSIRILSFSGILFWWFFSLSPFALAGPGTGQYYIVPSADNALPTGSYVTFYKFLHDGFYQAKYDAVIKAATLSAQTIFFNETKSKIEVINDGNESFFILAIAELDMKRLDKWEQYSRLPSDKNDTGARYLMLIRDYLFDRRIPKLKREEYYSWLQNGQVQSLEPGKVFPAVIEIGDSVKQGNDFDLARRIVFALSYYQYGIVRSIYYPDIYRPTFWLPASESMNFTNKPIYCDNQFCAFDVEVSGSEVWILELPSAYLGEQDLNNK